jgi:hypothetical protein
VCEYVNASPRVADAYHFSHLGALHPRTPATSVLSYLTVDYVRIPLVLSFFASKIASPTSSIASCQALLRAVLIEPSAWTSEHAKCPIERVPCERALSLRAEAASHPLKIVITSASMRRAVCCVLFEQHWEWRLVGAGVAPVWSHISVHYERADSQRKYKKAAEAKVRQVDDSLPPIDIARAQSRHSCIHEAGERVRPPHVHTRKGAAAIRGVERCKKGLDGGHHGRESRRC